MQRLIFFILHALMVGFLWLEAKGAERVSYAESLLKSDPAKVVELLTPILQQPNGKIHSYKVLCRAYLNLGRYYKADSVLGYVFRNYTFKNDSAAYISLLMLEAENKKILEMYDESLGCLNKVLDYTLQHGTKQDLIEVYLQFGEYYRAATNFDLSLQYLNKIYEVGDELPEGLPPIINARVMNRRAAVYGELAIHLDSVEFLSKRAIALATRYNDSDLVASSCNELGFYYLNTNNPAAVAQFKKAILIWSKMGFSSYAYHAKLNLARHYLRSHQPKKAIELASDGIVVAKASGWSWNEGHWNEIFAGAYEELGEYKKALFYLNRAKESLLQLSTNQYKERLAYYSNKLEVKKKEEELILKNIEVEQAQKEVESKSRENKYLFYLISVLLSGLAATGIFLVVTNRQKKLLKKQKEEVASINEALSMAMEQKEVLIKEVNHRVKNNLSILAGLMYMKEKELNDSVAVKALKDMQSRIHAISLVHESLYQRDDVGHINFQEYLERLASQINELYPSSKKINVTINCEGFNPELMLAMPLSMMLNELVTNSIKYAFEQVSQPEIVISFNPDAAMLEYHDNGPGYEFKNAGNSLGQKLLFILSTQIGANIQSVHAGQVQKIQIMLKQLTQ